MTPERVTIGRGYHTHVQRGVTMYDEYAATLKRVIDGDTFELDVDLGFDVRRTVTIRLLGIDCPEISTPAGREARAFTEDWFKTAGEVFVYPSRTSNGAYAKSFIRYVARIISGRTGMDLAENLRSAGYVKK